MSIWAAFVSNLNFKMLEQQNLVIRVLHDNCSKDRSSGVTAVTVILCSIAVFQVSGFLIAILNFCDHKALSL